MDSSKIKLRYRDRDLHFKKEYSHLKIKVALNWIVFLSLTLFSFFITFKTLISYNTGSLEINLSFAILIAFVISAMFYRYRKHHLKITRFDKEDIYKNICSDLIDQRKGEI